MSMSDPVSDFLTRIRNATMRRHDVVEIPASNLKVEIAKVLKEEGYIVDWQGTKDKRNHPAVQLVLKYDGEGESVIRGIQRVSRPGLRKTSGHGSLQPVMNGQGIAIVSTSKGVITDSECRKQKVGGEVLCHVW